MDTSYAEIVDWASEMDRIRGVLQLVRINFPALSRYDHRLPYRKIGNRFEQLHGLELSGASARHATERAVRAGRSEYDHICHQIQQADVVHVDETGIKRDGEQA